MTWCDGYFDGATVNHIDGNSLNNHADNLEWISHADNIRHGFEIGLYPQAKGDVHYYVNTIRFDIGLQ